MMERGALLRTPLKSVHGRSHFTLGEPRFELLPGFHLRCVAQNFSGCRIGRDGITARQNLFWAEHIQPLF